MKAQAKRFQIISILLIICINSPLFNIMNINAADTKPTLWIKIHRIEEVDDIEGFLKGGPEWYYQILVWDGEEMQSYTRPTQIGNGIVATPNHHSFTLDDLSSSNTFINIILLESDLDADDIADISSHSGGGQEIPPTRGAIYTGQYNLKTNSLTGDTTIIEGGYYKTSGDYDGSTSTNEHDANLWFDIGDNYDSPVAYAGPNMSNYAGDKVNFDGSGSTASSGSSIVLYEWDFDDDGRIDATGAKTSYTFNQKGKYTVTLRVTDSIGETDQDTCQVNIQAPGPTASYTYSPEEPTIQDTVNFYDTSSDPFGSIVSWYWDFGDGFTSTHKDPSHKYSDKGSYTVSLTVTDDDDISDSITKIITFVNLPPTADFSYSPASPKEGKDVQFSDESSDPEGKTLEYLWDFGDGFTSSQRNPKHKFTSSGMKYVKLTVTDDEDSEDLIQKIIRIIANVPPKADFSYAPENQKINHEVQFTDESTDSDGNIFEWLWNFGDDSTSTLESPTHTYEEGGEYSVKLTVTDDADDKDDIIKIVKILLTHDLTIEVRDILGLKISNAEVGLYTGGECCVSGKTDPNGKLTFNEVAEGQYDIKVKVMGQTITTTSSLSQPITEQVQVTLSTNTIGITGGIVVIAALIGFYFMRRKKIGQPAELIKQEEIAVSVVEDDSLKEKKKELERERIAEILQTFSDSYDKGEIDEETYHRLKAKYEKELEELE